MLNAFYIETSRFGLYFIVIECPKHCKPEYHAYLSGFIFITIIIFGKIMRLPHYSGVSFMKFSIDFNLNMYVHTIFCICTSFQIYKTTRTPEPAQKCINPSQRKILCSCISTLSPPQNHHIWRLRCLVLLCVTSFAYHACTHPRDTMFNSVKGTRNGKILLSTINAICSIHITLLKSI